MAMVWTKLWWSLRYIVSFAIMHVFPSLYDMVAQSSEHFLNCSLYCVMLIMGWSNFKQEVWMGLGVGVVDIVWKSDDLTDSRQQLCGSFSRFQAFQTRRFVESLQIYLVSFLVSTVRGQRWKATITYLLAQTRVCCNNSTLVCVLSCVTLNNADKASGLILKCEGIV